MIPDPTRRGAWNALAGAVGVLPWKWLGAVGAFVGSVAGSLLRIRRTEVEEAMRLADVPHPKSTASAMYRSLGAGALEFLWLARHGRRALAHVAMDEASAAAWKHAMSQGRGVVVAGSHTGNWDLAACAMADRCEFLVVTKRLRAVALDDFWQATRASLGVRLASATGAMAEARSVLARGGGVAMMMDQVPERAQHGLLTPFLGREALTSRGPATLAFRSGAPLVVAACRRDERGRHWLHVLSVLAPPSVGGLGWVERATREATGALDAFVRAFPSQWLWLHRRWRAPLRAEVDRRRRGGTLAQPCKTPSSLPDAPSQVA